MATIVLERVSVDFPIYGAQRSLRKALFQRATGGIIEHDPKHHERLTVKALSDISLTLHDGDRVGLVGHNGSGKTTLLKLLAGIYQPVSGQIRIEGRVTPLFDTMPGLEGEDTGYENIITSGMLIGLTRKEIEAKIPEIEEFCELGEYLGLPVRTYSSGMRLRLGFALATALDPGVLLMDEGFGTGDLRFAERAEARMKQFIGRSRIVVLASHADTLIRSICNKAIMMEAGKIVAFGPVHEVCDHYYDSVRAVTRTMIEGATDLASAVREFPDNPEKSGVVRRVAIVDELREPKVAFGLGDVLTIQIDYHIKVPKNNVSVMIAISRGHIYIFQTHDTDLNPSLLETRQPGFYRATVPLPRRLLTAGNYSITAKISFGHFSSGGEDSANDAVSFILHEEDQMSDIGSKGWAKARGMLVIVEQKWTTQQLEPA